MLKYPVNHRELKADGLSNNAKERIMYWEYRVDNAKEDVAYHEAKLKEAGIELKKSPKVLSKEKKNVR